MAQGGKKRTWNDTNYWLQRSSKVKHALGPEGVSGLTDGSKKNHWELLSSLHCPLVRGLNRDNMSCLHDFPTGEIIATPGALTML